MVVRRKGTYTSVADIPRDKDGFPVAGLVVRHFRDKRKFTQPQLARKLGMKEITVRLMETKNQGLDSMARRRALCQLLGIPPIVLGFGTLEQLEQFLSSDSTSEKTGITIPTVLKDNGKPSVEVYSQVLTEYNQTHLRQSGASLVDAVEIIIPSLYEQVRYTSDSQEKQKYLRVLWEFHNIAAKLQNDYTLNIELSDHHRGGMLTIGRELHNPVMIAHAHKGLAYTRLLEEPQLARTEIDAAIAVLKDVPPIVQSDTYAYASLIYLLSKTSSGDVKMSQHYFDLAQQVQPKPTAPIDERIPMGVTVVGCRFRQIEVLIANKKAHDALDIIEATKKIILPKSPNRETLLSIRRAQCYLLLGYPEYAMQQLGDAYSMLKTIGDRYKRRLIVNIYHGLKAGKYANHRAVLDFEEQLLKL